MVDEYSPARKRCLTVFARNVTVKASAKGNCSDFLSCSSTPPEPRFSPSRSAALRPLPHTIGGMLAMGIIRWVRWPAARVLPLGVFD
jgi:hypothetical protein